MPLARIGSKLIYFAHVPKCAGTAVENYLYARFGPLAMVDSGFGSIPESERWSRTSPQHMPESTRQRNISDDFIDASFAVVRHPAERLRSVFLFQREIEQRIPPGVDFGGWLEQVAEEMQDPSAYDGHLRPMHLTVPEKATVFWLEDGLDLVVHWLDALAGDVECPREIKRSNVLAERLARMDKPVATVELKARDYLRIAELYAQDYQRFGYGTAPGTRTEAPT